MRLNRQPAIGQPQAEATPPAFFTPDLCETLEDVRTVGLGDARAGIQNADRDFCFLPRYGHRDGAFDRSMFDGIVQ